MVDWVTFTEGVPEIWNWFPPMFDAVTPNPNNVLDPVHVKLTLLVPPPIS